MKNRNFKKTLSVFLSVLMILSCWVWIAPTDAEAANTYYVRVYLNIYDGANSDGYGNPYTVVTDPNSDFYGKPDDYKWDYGSSWSLTDNSAGYDGEINMAGFTLFYDNDTKYETYDLAADLVNATTVLGNNWTSMDDLTLENFDSWPNKEEKVYGFTLDAMPSSLFWINDENNAVNGETSFGIYKITVAETSTSQEHILWTGLSGSESYYECYYGTITPTGIITPWDDCPDATTYTFYKDYTTSAIGTWIDPFNAGDYNVYPVNNYLSGGVSASFTVGNRGSQTNIDYVDVGNTNNYYINFTNHSTQDATITLFKADNQSLLSGYYDNYPIPSGKTVSFALNKSSMGGDGDYVDFSFKFKLNNVYNSDGTTQTDFYQAAGIGTWNTTDDLKAIGKPAGESANNGFTLYESSTWGYNIDISNRFMVDVGILEEVSTSGNRTAHVDFVYNYWFENSGITDWSQTGLRLYAEKYTNYRHVLQEKTTDGTLSIGGNIANSDASLAMADLVKSYASSSDSFTYPAKTNRPWAYIGSSCVPQWAENSNDEWSSLVNIGSAYFRFCGIPFKGSSTSANPGTITFTNMVWRDYEDDDATFSGTINVYSFDKTQLREYVYSLGGLGANWAPMRTRFNDAQWNAYEIALKTAKEVLANQKTNQKAVTDAYNALYSATEALKATSSLKSQVAEVTYTQRETDYASTAIQTKQKYIIMPIGTETAVPAYDTYKYASSGNIVGKQTSNLKTNYTQYDTGINPIDYRYWKIDYTGVSEAIAEATALLDSPLDTYSDAYYEALFDARTSVSYFDRDADTWTPTYQSDISNPLAELNALLAHAENNYDACIYDGSDEDTYADIVNENYNCIDGGTVEHVCIICGKAQVVETKDPQEGGHTLTYVNNNDGTHTATCTECDFSETVAHTFTNPVLVRPTLVDGTWTDGTYTYTCICGAKKVEPAVRADYSELEDAVDALEELKDNENLTDEAKEAINAAIKKADDLADDLVTAEQKQIDDLVKELQKVKADAEEAIRNKEIGVEKITEANSGVKVQFIDESGLGAIDSIQLGKDEGFIIRVANGNADSDITITKLNGDAVNKTLASGESTDFNISADGLTAGIATYTITYTIDGLKDADGNLVEFTTEAYLYVKEEAYQPYHYLHEVAWQGQDMALQYYVEANYGDFTANNPTGAEKFNDNMEVNEVSTWRYDKYDYGTTCYDANCTGGTDCTAKSDAHLATYNYYVDTSLVKTWEDAGFRTRFVETAASNYDKVNLKYLRLAVNQTYLDGIAGDDKTFTVTFVPSASGTANATMQFSSTGDLTIQHIVEPANDTLLFGSRSTNATNNTAYANFSGTIPVGVNADGTAPAMFMFAPKLRMTGGLAADEASYMTTHIALTSYDKAALREAVANAEQAGYNSEYFNPEKYEAYEEALKNAKEVLGKAETNQNEIDAATAALNAAIADLEKAENEAKFVLTVTHSIHESADKNSEATGTEYDYYLVNGEITPALKTSIIALDTINKYDAAATLNVTADAEHTYNYWYIDYSGVQGAIDAADAIIENADDYSEDFINELTEKKEALEDILEGKDATTTPESQDDVDDAIDAVTDLTGHTHDYKDATCTEAKTCKICGVTDGKANGHTWGEPVLTKNPTADEQGEYTETCEVCGATQITKVDLADYSEFNTVVGQLEDLLDTENLTDEAKAAIEEALDKAEALDKNLHADATTADGKLIEGGQDEIDALVNALKDVVADTNAAIADGSALKPDYEAWEEAKDAYDALDKTNVKDEIITEAEALKAEIAEKQADDTLTQATATQDEIDDATARLNEIIAGITDGSLKDPADYTEVDKDLADAKDKAENNDVVDGVKDDIQEIEDKLNELKNDPTTNADDQDEIDALEKELEDIIAGIEDGSLVKPDYEAWEEAKDAYDALDKTNVKDEIITEAEALKAEIAEKQADDTLTQATATQKDIDEATARLNEIIAGITDGSLKDPADYTEVDKDLADAKDKAENNDVVDGVKEDIQEIEDKLNELKNDPTTNADDQDEIDALEKELEDIIAGIEDGSLVKPDYEAWEEAETAYDALDKTNVKDEIITEAEGLKAEIAEKQADDTLTQKTATQKDIDEATARLNEIIAGITDGSLKDPADYTEVDKDLADAKDKAENNDVVDGVKEDIQEIEDKLNELKNDPTTNADDQDEIDALEKELEDIIAGIEDGSLVKVDYTKYNNAVDAYEALKDTMTAEDKAAVGAIKAEIAEIPVDGTKKDYQAQVDKAAEDIAAINAKYGDCANGNHTWGEPVLTKDPTADEQGEYTETCEVCGATQITKVDLADYSEFNTVVGQLEDLLDTENLTDEAKAAIEEALDRAEALDKNLPDDATTVDGKLIEGGQDEIYTLVNELKDVVADTNAAIADGSALKPDYTAWETAEGTYDALDKTNVKAEIITEANNLKAAIAEKQADKSHTQATATQAEINAATARLNEIIAGINNGTYKNPDYSGAETAIQNAKDTADNENIPDSKEAEIEAEIAKLEEELQNLKDTNPDSTNAEAMEKINEIKAEAEAIVEKYKDCVAGTHDYADATCTAPETCKDCGATNGDPLDHVDTDNDHICNNGCNGKISECTDAATDGDHKCDICGAENVTGHDYADATCTAPETCKDCGATNGDPLDHVDTDNDHICNNGCNGKISDCSDVTTDTDHNCDICGAADVTEHNYVGSVLTRPTKNDDGTWNNGYYTSTCNCGATSTTEAERANYTAYDEAVADLNELLADATLTDEAIAKINKVLADNKIDDNLVTAEQSIVDDAAAALKVVLDEINGNKDAYQKPDYEAWKEAEGAYDALDKTNVKDEIINEANALKAEIADKQADDSLTQATATQDEIDDATARLNEIIDGINDGSLKDPDYSKVEEKLEDVNEAEGLNKDTQDKIDAIEKELQDIKDKTEPEANYRDDQDEVEALEDLLDEILEDIADGTAKAPDYTNWDSAEGTYDALDKTNVKDEILDEVTDLKNTINNLKADPTANAKEDQKTIDDATKRLLEIIDGITDGSLLNPDAECVHDYATVEVEPTCHSVGYTLYVCKKCKDSYKVNGAPAIDHNWKWSESKTGSCLEAKTRTGYCLNDGCNATKTEYVRDADGNIVYGNHVYVVIEGKPATCTTPGHTDYTRCVNCGEITESVTIPAPGHIDSDNNGNCDVCNYLTKPAVGKCDCLCHNDSFFGKLIYKIANFFWKLFKINQGCQCGVQHW